MFRERESRFFIDCKHIFIERKKASKTQAFINFITNSIIDLTEKSPLSPQEKKNLETYVQDYISYIIQKKTLLQKELKQILFDALICLKAVMPQLPDIPGPRDPQLKEYDLIIEKNLSFLSLFHVRKEVREHIKHLMENPYELKFYYFSKYQYKEQVIRALVEAEVPEILHYLSFYPFTSMGPKDYIVTGEPRASGGFKKHNLIYYSVDTMPIFRKLTFENEMGGFDVATEISCISQLSDTILFIKENQDQSPRRERPVRIGYCFSQKKLMQLQKNNRALASRYPIEFIPVDLRVPLDKDIQYFFHKISDQTKENSDPWRDIKIANFDKIRETIPLLDPLDHIDVLSDRRLFQDVVSEIFSSQTFLDSMKKATEGKDVKEVNFKVPKIAFVDPKDPQRPAESVIEQEGMKFPMVVKTAAACGDKNSHFMAIVLNNEGLKEVQTSDIFKEYSFILQEYIEHDERIYKVYVVGDDFQVGQKQSLPNLTDKGVPKSHFYFDSQISFKDHPEFSKLSKGYEALDIDRDVVNVVSKELNRKLTFSLYGFDLIREAKTGDYYLIDVNYFPGYTGYKDFKEVLHRHFYSIYKNRLLEINAK